MRTLSRRSAVATISVLTLLGGALVGLPAQAASGDRVAAQPTRVHWSGGKPLAGEVGPAPGHVVKSYLAAHGAGAAAATLQPDSAWKTHGLTVVRLGQTVSGLRVPATDAKAVFGADGALLSVVENAASISGKPAAASVSDGDALRAAVASLYPGRSVSTASPHRSGNVTTYEQQGFSAAPTVETVALPPDDRQGNGRIRRHHLDRGQRAQRHHGRRLRRRGRQRGLRTSSDRYNVFTEDPDKTRADAGQRPGPSDRVAGGLARRRASSTNITGNNVHAYLDADNNNPPDPAARAVGRRRLPRGRRTGTVQPTTAGNHNVAVQNLFYLNNLIHDTLYRAGFNEAAGNFQENNFGHGGTGSDSVNAEAQDGGGTDNANFATPSDGQNPRMQMYLWTRPRHPPGRSPAASTYAGAGARFGAPLDADRHDRPAGARQRRRRARPPTAASRSPRRRHRQIAIVDRGTCDFVVKVKNAQRPARSASIVANNAGDRRSRDGRHRRHVTIPRSW